MPRTANAVFWVMAVSALLSVPAGGFVFGCISPAPIAGGGGTFLGDLAARMLFGLLFAAKTTIAFGFPSPDASQNIAPLNIWPYIFAMFIPVFAITLYAARKLNAFSKNTA